MPFSHPSLGLCVFFLSFFFRGHTIPEMVVSPLLARPGGGHGRGGGDYTLARPSSDSLSGRLRVGFVWRGPCAALRKAACAEGASGASFGRCAPPAAGGGPCRRAPAPWTGRGGGAAAPQRLLHAGAALCCLVGSMLVLCAVFARRLWRCTACRGEWREARAAPHVARTAPENALDEPAGAARAPCKLAHRLHAAVDSLVDGGQSHDCRSKPAGFVTPFTQSFLPSLSL